MPRVTNPHGYRLRYRHAILPEEALAADLARVARAHPPSAGWEAARDAYRETFRHYLRAGRAFLHHRFLSGAGGRELVRGHAYLVDHLLWRLWELLPDYLDPARCPSALAVAAVGGYGRAELLPHSDVDLLILHEGFPNTAAGVAEPYLHFLWDLGLPVSHALRTPAECVADAAELTTQTALLEARHLAGDRHLFRRMRKRLETEVFTDPDGFMAAKLAEQAQRHDRYGGPVYSLEPNVKESWGGLRDIHTLFWVAKYRHGVTQLDHLAQAGVLAVDEQRDLRRAQDFLWRVRAALHYLSGRDENRLLFDHQRTLASRFGYRDTEATLAVEKFMKRFFRTAHQVVAITGIALEGFREQDGVEQCTLTPGLCQIGQRLEATDPDALAADPARIPDFFVRLQGLEPRLRLGARTLRALRHGARAVDDRTRADPRARRGLRTLLSRPGRVGGALRLMNTYGLLGRLVPEFGRVVGQTQHNLFHIYPVDEHTLQALETLDRFRRGEAPEADECPLACRLARQVKSPAVLYLAMLCHDIDKGRKGDHSRLGAATARRVARRLGLDAHDVATVGWLVREHLTLSQMSQKRDIHDPETVAELVAFVGDSERLDLLFLLTEADMRATGPKIWNTWKAQLLQDLYTNTRAALRAAEPIDAEARVRRLQRRVLRELLDEGYEEWAVRAHLRRLGRDYFLHYHPQEVIAHTRTLLSEGGPTIVQAAPHPRAAGTEILLYSPDRPGLFTRATGTLAGLGLNIVEAKVHTTRDFWALDTFIVLDDEDQPVEDPGELAAIRERLSRAVAGPGEEVAPPGRRTFRHRAQRHFPTPVRVEFTRSASGEQTVMEVITPDTPGVLYRIGHILTEHGCNIHGAKVATLGERTEDTFFLTRDGAPLEDPQERQVLAAAIRAEFEPEDAAAPAGGS